jgi:hypothetical protein
LTYHHKSAVHDNEVIIGRSRWSDLLGVDKRVEPYQRTWFSQRLIKLVGDGRAGYIFWEDLGRLV